LTWTIQHVPETRKPGLFPLRFAHSSRSKKAGLSGAPLCFALSGSRPPRVILPVWRRQGQPVPLGKHRNEKENIMANALGYVTETKTGFEGALAMLNLTAPIKIEKNADKAAYSQPDYRIFAGEILTEIGGGWIITAKSSGKEYISLTLADPQIGPRKVYANLAPVKGKKGRYVLLWNPKD